MVSKNKKTLIVSGIVILALIVGGAFYLGVFTNTQKSSTTNNNKTKATVTGTPSTPIQHTSTPSSSNSSPTQSSTSSQSSQTTTSSTPPSSQWATSSSGAITLQEPYSDETIQSGATISGTAESSVSTVNYILTDNSVGQIAQGSLDVVNGKFTGTLHFTSHSTAGTLQVYSPNPSNGAEENIINIDVNYN